MNIIDFLESDSFQSIVITGNDTVIQRNKHGNWFVYVKEDLQSPLSEHVVFSVSMEEFLIREAREKRTKEISEK